MLHLLNGPVIAEPLDRMLRFCHEEYPYYDGLPPGDPNRVEPLDVLAAVAVNGFSNLNAEMIRKVHRGLATACNPVLSRIPRNADLLRVDPSFTDLANLLTAAVGVPEVLIPRATKVLHRKRSNLIPMLDMVLLSHYLRTVPGRLSATQDKTRAAGVVIEVLGKFRADLESAHSEIDAVTTNLAAAGFMLSPVRVLEVLLWTEVEERGYYR
jgi:Family of unknown function (DUF6308)